MTAHAREHTETRTLNVLDFAFEGKPLTVVHYNNAPHWIAREVGDALGFSGDQLVSITGEWSEFERDADYVIVEGDELRAFEAWAESHLQGRDFGPGRCRHLTLLTESGLHLALLEADHRLSIRVRRFLAREVMPRLAPVGSANPGRPVNGPHVAARHVSGRNAIDIEAPGGDRAAAAVLQRLFVQLWRSKRLGDDQLANLAVTAAELETGLDLSDYRTSETPLQPAVNATVKRFVDECCLSGQRTRTTAVYDRYRRWAERAGLPALNSARFGRVLSQLGIRALRSHSTRVYPVGLRDERAAASEDAA